MKMQTIENPKLRVVEDLKIRNQQNLKTIAGEYFGSKFTYAETFKMFEDFKKALIHVDGLNEHAITISAPSTIASVNAFYGTIDANKIANMVGPGFLQVYTEKYTKEMGSQTAIVFDGFLNDDMVVKMQAAGVKNLIITSITDYMSPVVKLAAQTKGLIDGKDFLDEYVKRHKTVPQGMEMIRLKEFANIGKRIKETYEFPYEEGKIAAHFLTGATTSQVPKCVQIYADGITKMARIYDNLWYEFKVGDRNTIFIPPFYATGAIHGIHAGLMHGMTLIYKPKYDRFAFAKDLSDSKATLALAAPSHVATLDESGLPDNSLNHVKYIFIGGEAIMPAQMEKFRLTAKRLGIHNIVNTYGMTETGSGSGSSDVEYDDIRDVTVRTIPGIQYRIADPETGEILSNNERGILEVKSPCATAGYMEEAKNKDLFTPDGWIHTGDIAVRYDNGKYRIFGRVTDCFVNSGKTYPMYDIEEQVLTHPAVAEAEVIKFNIVSEEYPAMVVVLKSEWQDRIATVLRDLSVIDVSGMEFLLGIRFVDKFKTNPVTAKRDYLSLANETTDYYSYDKDTNTIYCVNIGTDKVEVADSDVSIIYVD